MVQSRSKTIRARQGLVDEASAQGVDFQGHVEILFLDGLLFSHMPFCSRTTKKSHELLNQAFNHIHLTRF